MSGPANNDRRPAPNCGVDSSAVLFSMADLRLDEQVPFVEDDAPSPRAPSMDSGLEMDDAG